MNTEDIVLYNTEEQVKTKPTATPVETFDLVPPDHPALYKVLPEFDFENAQGHLGLASTDTIPVLVAAIKELKSELESVKTELNNLKNS